MHRWPRRRVRRRDHGVERDGEGYRRATASGAATWACDTALRPVLLVGNYVVNATEAAAKAFADKVGRLGQSINGLLGELSQFGTAAGAVLQALVSDPSGFLTNLGKSVGKGVEDSFNGLPATLPAKLLSWVTSQGGLTNVPPFPTDTSAQAVGNWLLDVFDLNWDSIQAMLVGQLGAGNVALIAQAYDYLKAEVGDGNLGAFEFLKVAGQTMTADDLKARVIAAGVNFVRDTVVPAIVREVAKKFVPGGAVVSTVYNALDWLANDVEKVQGLASLAGTVLGKIGAVAAGDQNAVRSLAGDVTGFLNGAIEPALSFAAGQLGLGTLPAEVGTVIAQVRAYPLGKLAGALGYVAGKAKGRLGPVPLGTVARYATTVPGHALVLRVAIQGAGVAVLRSADGGPEAALNLKADLPGSAAGSKAQLALDALKADGAAAVAASRAAEAAARAGQALPRQVAAPLLAAAKQLAIHIRAEMQALIQSGATCFFGLACFAAGTPMRTPGGSKAVEDFKVGDWVLSRDERDPHAAVVVRRSRHHGLFPGPLAQPRRAADASERLRRRHYDGKSVLGLQSPFAGESGPGDLGLLLDARPSRLRSRGQGLAVIERVGSDLAAPPSDALSAPSRA